MNILITITAVLLISYLFSFIFKRLNFPNVAALITAGLFLSMPFIRQTLISPNKETIFSLGNIGLLALMFLAGIESSWKILNSEKKDSIIIAFFAYIIPFTLGFIVFRLIGFSIITSLIVGICMSITAEATKAKILIEMKKLRTKVGSAMLGAGIIDDALGMAAFVLITYLLKKTFIKQDLFLAGAIISFMIGMTLQSYIKDDELLKNIEKIFLTLLVPFFFISVGLNFDINSLFVDPKIVLLIILVAIIGKILGTFLAKPFTEFNTKQLHLIGWAMNSRGAVEIALALIAFKSGLIPIEIYSGLVAMALVTTLMFSFIIYSTVSKNPDIMLKDKSKV